MDEAGWLDDARIGVLMPYTSCRGAWCMIDDLCRIAEGRLSASDCRVYIYPYDQAGDNGERPLQDATGTCAAQPARLPEEHPLAAMCLKDCPSESNRSARPVGDGPIAVPLCVHALQPHPRDGLPTRQRALDILCSALGLIVLAPVFILVALLIKLVSPGSVFFKQERIGQGGKPFVLWKFRTMTADADCSVHQGHVIRLIRSTAENADAAEPMTKLDNDPRIIPLGGLLRGACIDELPQLINVFRGQMSLVGPRPPIAYEVSEYRPWQRRRLDTVPGLTGLWQVSGKNKLTFDEMVRLDIRYSRQQSLWTNIMILLRTPRAVAGEIADLWARCRMRVRVTENA
jgi:lipopolysaccharide/colanic/teichoic acid biosynthesis glycosyltransferase